MPTALVTGPLESAADMALALKSAGFEVLAAETDVGQVPGGLGQVDCYVQLPPDPPPQGIAGHTLLARFDAAAQVAPMLATQAQVVLVADRADAPAPDMRLVRILIEAVIADHGGDDVRVAIVDGVRPPDEIAAVARSQPRPWAAYPADRRLT